MGHKGRPVAQSGSQRPRRNNRRRPWRCPITACVSFWKLAFTSAIRPTAGTRRWVSYIFGTRNNIHIIDLAQSVPMLHKALEAVSDTVAKGGRILFVGTKRQAQDAIAEAAKRCAQYYVNSRWLGGTLTNWKTISGSIARLRKLEEMLASNEAGGYTKKERLDSAARARQARPLARRHQGHGRPARPGVRDRHQQGRHRDQGGAAPRRAGRRRRRHQLRSGRHHLSSCRATTTPAARSRSTAI